MLWRSMSPGIRGRTDNGKEKEMDKLEGLRAGLAEMRSVAQRLNQWADDLEQAFQNSDAPRNEGNAGKPVPAEKKKKSAAGKFAADSVVPEEKKVLTLPDVRAVLVEKCAAGFSAQVKALIESYGVEKLRDLPADRYEELLEAVKELGDMDAG